MTIEKKIIESISDKQHPSENSILEKPFSPNIKPEKSLPIQIVKFQDDWCWGVSQYKEIIRDVKKIYNGSIEDCLKKIDEVYGYTKDQGLAMFMKTLLRENMLEI